MTAEREPAGDPPDDGSCAMCGAPGAAYPRWSVGFEYLYSLCASCHRDVRSWSPRERGPRAERRELPAELRERVIP